MLRLKPKATKTVVGRDDVYSASTDCERGDTRFSVEECSKGACSEECQSGNGECKELHYGWGGFVKRGEDCSRQLSYPNTSHPTRHNIHLFGPLFFKKVP